MRSSWHRCSLLAIALLAAGAGSLSLAEETVTLVAGERPPYIGAALPEKGYVFELVQEAFKRRGYRATLEFYPWARAAALAAKGEVDGLVPAQDDSADSAYVYSNPFPGGTTGLLKKKSFRVAYPKEDGKPPSEIFQALKAYRFGTVRGGVSLPAFDEAQFLTREMANADVQNLDKLDAERIHFSLIDKYSAADLMVGQRPHLIGHLEFLRPPLAQRDFHVAFSAKAPRQKQLLAAFNEGLDELVRDGSLTRILEKHGFFQPKKNTTGKVQLTIGTVNNSDMLVMQRLSREFEKQHPNIELEWRVLDENTLRLRLLSDLAISDGQFDIMTIGTYEVPIWARQQWLTPLQDMPEKYEVNDLLSSVRGGLSYNGQLFAAPFYAESSMTFYRKDLFAKAGLTMPAKPRYDEILKFASKIHNAEAGVYGICMRGKPGWGENMAILSTMVNTFGGRWFDPSWRPELDSPVWEQAISFYKDLLTKYGPPHPERNGFNENLALFSEGHCGMWIDATVAAGMLFDAKRSRVAEQLGYVAAPVAVTDKGSAWLWSWALAIPNSSLHKKEAKEFIAWATSKTYIQSVAKNFGWIAVPPGTRKSTYANPNYLQAAPFAQFVLQAIESADVRNAGVKARPYVGIQYAGIPEFPAIGNQVGAEIAKSLHGELSVKEALSRAQSFTVEQMKNSGYLK